MFSPPPPPPRYFSCMDLPPDNNPWHNLTFWTAALGWTLAQLVKFTTHYCRTRTLDFRYFVSTGGMPSAHSAFVSALAASIGIAYGIASPLFALATVFALIVMFDAQSVRRAAGHQARVLNQIAEELVKHHHLPKREKLAELLGHTRHEVLAGSLLGIATAFATHALAGKL